MFHYLLLDFSLFILKHGKSAIVGRSLSLRKVGCELLKAIFTKDNRVQFLVVELGINRRRLNLIGGVYDESFYTKHGKRCQSEYWNDAVSSFTGQLFFQEAIFVLTAILVAGR